VAEQVSMLAGEPTPPGAAPRRKSTALPPYLLAKARSRLSFLTLLFAGMCVLGTAIDRLLAGFYLGDGIYQVYVFNFVTSSALFLVTRSRRLSDRVVLNLGLVYEILMCLTVSIAYTWIQYGITGTPPGVTWVCIVLVAYPLIIPTPPRRTLVVATCAAVTVPLGLYVLQALGSVSPRPFDYVDISISPALCVALAVMGARVVYGLNVEVARARRLGSYQLVERLGAGGMGEVWRASHRLLARPAAVKLVRPEIQAKRSLDQQRVLDRFRREAEVTACLQSPHTVRLYDFGTTDEGVFYYVMDAHEAGHRARQRDSGRAFPAHRGHRSSTARRDHHGVPGETPGRPPAECGGSWRPAARHRPGGRLDPGARAGLVATAPSPERRVPTRRGRDEARLVAADRFERLVGVVARRARPPGWNRGRIGEAAARQAATGSRI